MTDEERARKIEAAVDEMNRLQVLRGCAADGSGPELTADEEDGFNVAVDLLGHEDTGVPWLLEKIDRLERAIDYYQIIDLQLAVVCPGCGSGDGDKLIMHHDAKEHRIEWRCDSCGHKWVWKHPFYERQKRREGKGND